MRSGGFIKTEPAYEKGWHVIADRDSNLYNLADAKDYPYLFWEGYGLNYKRPQSGFVVAKADVYNFLKSTLSKLGLNTKESADFMDFWAPKMQAKPYYLVSFVEQSEFNRLAPLSVSPRPDTVIRVFMDYTGLDKPFSVQEPKIITPFRHGFTVVEWGGALARE